MKFRSNILLFAASVGLFFFSCVSAKGVEVNNKNVEISSADIGDTTHFYLTARNIMEATVQLDFDRLENATTAPSVPYVFSVDHPYDRHHLLVVKSKNSDPFNFHFNYIYKIGLPSALRSQDYLYSLPYAAPSQYKCSQSQGGKFSHKKGSHEEFAVDFGMPEGTPILAARPGKVIAFRDDSTVGGPSRDNLDWENFVAVKHNDGTYALYVHLKQNGVLVKLGQTVNVGTPIGLSGSTGWSTKPHLHFEVFRVKSAKQTTSIPFRMKTSKGIVTRMIEGERY